MNHLPANAVPTFDEWWVVYPRKQGKADAEKKFAKLSDVDKYNCLQGTVYQTEHNPQWKDPSYIPLPSTFINQKRWQDEIVEGKDAKARVVESASNSNAHTVWAAMVGMYGQAWINKFGEEPDRFWSGFLNGITPARIQRALRYTLENDKEFPPSLPKFKGYCRPTFEEQYPPALPKPPGDKAKALAAFDEVNKILRAKNEESG